MPARMFLRPIDPVVDGAALHAIFGDPECCTWLPEPAFASVADTIAKLKHWNNGFEKTSWAVAASTDGPALGRIALYNTGDDPDVWEAACMISPAARGQNLAARALSHAIGYLFETTTARRIFADIDPDNIASIRVFEKLGFTREGQLRGTWNTHIGIRDSVIYGLMKTDPQPDIGPVPVVMI
ncbi:GNAT family N-acetyltransferase [Thalassospira xiamenensis]|uniref:GNAT family N-acetyltransferase n=1 Tax=Thalassospira xiamenensis TaxID=220697 RepID=UPI00200001E4|nr:GNAT family N-acetyltransferase [Thalassospira xiamenensis]MCK2167972.1 GNAT family N-acetyltransferase [Thalassospira xiamenensis]